MLHLPPVKEEPPVPAPVIRPTLDAADTELLLEALQALGTATTDYDQLKRTTDLAARLRHAGRVFGLDWLEEHPT
jgi:hypothetical protein